MNGCKRGELSIRVNHLDQTLTFDPTLFATAQKGGADAGAARLQPMPSELMLSHLTLLSERLATALATVDPSRAEQHRTSKQAALAKIVAALKGEHNAALRRKENIERKKEKAEVIAAERERMEAKERMVREREEAAAEKVRLEEQARKRELEKMRREHAEVEREQALKLAEEMKKKNVKIDVEVCVSGLGRDVPY